MPFCPKCGTQVPTGAGFCPSCGFALGSTPASSQGGQPQTPVTGISTISRDVKAQEYWAKRLIAYVIDAIIVYTVIGLAVAAAVLPAFLMGVFVPGSSPPIFRSAATSGHSPAFSSSSISRSRRRPTARRLARG